MAESAQAAALDAVAAPPRAKASLYPEPIAARVKGREKRPLGDLFGLKNFGVNLTRLAPGAISALHHRHTRQDEFIYVLEGEPTLVTGQGRETPLRPGMCAGFPAAGEAHHLVNRSDRHILYLEVGDRSPEDEVFYPDDDLQVAVSRDGKRLFTHKDGRPY